MKLNTKILKGLSQAKIGPISTINDLIKAAEANKARQKAISDIESGIKDAEKAYKAVLDSESDEERKEKIEALYEIYREDIFDAASRGRIFLKLAKNGKILNPSNKDLMGAREVGNLRDPRQENAVKVFMWRVIPSMLDFVADFFLHPLRFFSVGAVEKAQGAFDSEATPYTQWFTFKFEDIQEIDLIKKDGTTYLYVDVIKTQYL